MLSRKLLSDMRALALEAAATARSAAALASDLARSAASTARVLAASSIDIFLSTKSAPTAGSLPLSQPPSPPTPDHTNRQTETARGTRQAPQSRRTDSATHTPAAPRDCALHPLSGVTCFDGPVPWTNVRAPPIINEKERFPGDEIGDDVSSRLRRKCEHR